jgi:hypothetical protein
VKEEAASFLEGLEEQMDRETTLQWVGSAAAFRVLHEPPPSPRAGSGCEPIRQLSRGEALISAVLLSLRIVGTDLGSDLPVGGVTPAVSLHVVPRREAIIKEDSLRP